MELVPDLLRRMLPYAPVATTIVLVIVGLWVVQRVLQQRAQKVGGHTFRDQLVMLGLTLFGILLVIMALPSNALRGQLLSLLGILLSAAIALSSTTVLSNAMAGFMLRAVRGFRMGDFIKVGDQFGRVSEHGLVHTEIQTPDRDLVTFPNLYLVTHPVTTIRSSGTIVSTTVSLGYDVPRSRVEKLLLAAASEVGLNDAFTQVLSLGDFSVTYRVAGLLTEVKTLITCRSNLARRVMDELHRGGVEIVSPTFMNQRVFPHDAAFIPQERQGRQAGPPEEVAAPEAVVFDKADEAEALGMMERRMEEMTKRLEELKKQGEESNDDAEKERISKDVAGLEERQKRLVQSIAERKKNVEE
ncbi:MAG: mechanosensitive ion channel [Acidobacteriota bacterium]|nr:mechanosensitive ion channel [Acidobacteriota bacterium]